MSVLLLFVLIFCPPIAGLPSPFLPSLGKILPPPVCRPRFPVLLSVLEVPASQFSKAQQFYQFQLDTYQSNLLLSSCSLRDQARIRAISSHSCASAWLRAIPSVPLGLTMSRQEFVCSLWYWLRIPVFAATDSTRCSCGTAVDCFGDHLLGCGHGPMRIRRHDALYVMLFTMLYFRIITAARENNAVVQGWIALVMFIILTFYLVSLLILM